MISIGRRVPLYRTGRCSYNILNPNITKKYIDDLKKGAEELLIDVKLDVALYRMGHTKAGLPPPFSGMKVCK